MARSDDGYSEIRRGKWWQIVLTERQSVAESGFGFWESRIGEILRNFYFKTVKIKKTLIKISTIMIMFLNKINDFNNDQSRSFSLLKVPVILAVFFYVQVDMLVNTLNQSLKIGKIDKFHF